MPHSIQLALTIIQSHFLIWYHLSGLYDPILLSEFCPDDAINWQNYIDGMSQGIQHHYSCFLVVEFQVYTLFGGFPLRAARKS